MTSMQIDDYYSSTVLPERKKKPAPEKKSRAREFSLDTYDLLDCIDRGLGRVGPATRYKVYWRMVVQRSAPSEGIIANPEAFVAALRSMFGNGAEQVEMAIVSEIAERVLERNVVVDLKDRVRQELEERFFALGLVDLIKGMKARRQEEDGRDLDPHPIPAAREEKKVSDQGVSKS
ncbi:MAG TPA: hypothetical protein VFF30_18140 [Nitrososphaerales archaeon]|nr:hypothetical protein [Nitrososphaerales archaeon]